MPFFTSNVWQFYKSYKKTNNIFEILKKFQVKHVLVMQKYWYENLTLWPDFHLTAVKSKLWWRHRVKLPSPSISTSKMNHKTCVTRHASDFYFLVTFCDLGLEPSRYDLCNHAVSFSDIYQHFVWVWALCCPSNRPDSHKCENSVVVFLLLTWLWPYTWPLS